MLKQSLVQEKISDLTIGAPKASTGVVTSSSSSSIGGGVTVPKGTKVIETNIISIYSSSSSPTNTTNNYRNAKLLANAVNSNNWYGTNKEIGEENANNKDFSNNNNNFPRSSNLNNNNNNTNNNSGQNNSNNNLPFNNNNSSSNSLNNNNNNKMSMNSNNSPNLNSRTFNSSSINDFDKNSGGDGLSTFDTTMKLSYLEKSIRFIQQQHVEILTGLHQEIEKLKNENRELYFRLATRKTSAGSNRSSSASKETTNSTEAESYDAAKEQISHKGFNKAYKENTKETNIEKKILDIKATYDHSKYDELYKKLKDAEGKSDYLTSVITQLQNQRNANSGYKSDRSHVNVNNSNTNITSNFSPSTAAAATNQANSKLNVKSIVSVEPLKIKLAEEEEPRAPNQGETDTLVKKLFDVYKLQKQQINNMKIVLRDMMINENLSSQSITMTRELLENSNRLNQYLLDNGSSIQKLSIITPLHQYPPKSSTGRFNFNTQKFNSHLLLNNGNPMTNQNNELRQIPTASSNFNLASTIVHLPPLLTNPVKFPERQRRTQILQKQRLRKEYFH